MKKLNTIILILLGMICTQLYAVQLNSIYPLKPNDSEAFYFTPENYPIKADGKMDVSDALQAAINQVKKEKNFGILFIPEGKYKISKTIYIPTAIRLIGYGKNRPEFILAKNSPGFQEEVADDKGKAKYMFWFTGAVVKEGEKPRDAGASTFDSAMSNIQAGMSFYGEMPDMFNLVLNSDHKLVKEVLIDEDKECAAAVAPVQAEMDEVDKQRNDLKKKQEGKKDEDIPTAEKDKVNELDKKWDELKIQKEGIFADYAAKNKVVRQLIDLALLQNGMLKGEALNNFVKRSIDLIK